MLTNVPINLRPGLLQKEAAAVIGVSVRTLNNWLHDRYGPTPVRDGRTLLYDRSAVEAFQAGVR